MAKYLIMKNIGLFKSYNLLKKIYKNVNSEYFYTWALAYKRVVKTGPPAEMKVRRSVEYQSRAVLHFCVLALPC